MLRLEKQGGVALIAVLWVVAALSLLVAGLLAMSRVQVHNAQSHVAIGQATALGDAAIQLAALEWKVSPPEPVRLTHRRYEIEGVPVEVRIIPATGFININNASETLLYDLFRFGAGLEEKRAMMLAHRVIDWRDADDEPLEQGAEEAAYIAAGVPWRPRNGRFILIEDLLQVLGLDFDVFDKIRPLVTLWSGAGGVDLRTAPTEVISVLAEGDLGLVKHIETQRESDSVMIDTGRLDPSHISGGTGSSVLRIEAMIPVDVQRFAVRVRWIRLAASRDGAPWGTLATESVRFISGGA